MDFVFFEDLAGYAIVTVDFLCQAYQDRFDKSIKVSELRWKPPQRSINARAKEASEIDPKDNRNGPVESNKA